MYGICSKVFDTAAINDCHCYDFVHSWHAMNSRKTDKMSTYMHTDHLFDDNLNRLSAIGIIG